MLILAMIFESHTDLTPIWKEVYACMQRPIPATVEGKLGAVRIAAKKAVKIPAKQAVVVQGEVSLPCVGYAYAAMLEPRIRDFPTGLVVNQNVIFVDRERQQSRCVPILIENHTDSPIWLYRRQILGDLYVCEVQGPIQTNKQSVVTPQAMGGGDGVIEGLDFSDSPCLPL